MVADQTLDRLATHQVRDEGTHVAALGDVAGVAEAVHQLRPRASGAGGVPTELGRLTGEPIPGQGRQHEVERVLRASAVRGGVGQRTDRIQQLDDRAGPTVGHDQRQRGVVSRLHVDEVNVHAVDLGRELRYRVQPRLHAAEVVLVRPVVRKRTDRRELDALRPIVDELLGGPTRRDDAASKVGQRVVGNVDLEWADLDGGLDSSAHGDLLATRRRPGRQRERRGRQPRRRGPPPACQPSGTRRSGHQEVHWRTQGADDRRTTIGLWAGYVDGADTPQPILRGQRRATADADFVENACSTSWCRTPIESTTTTMSPDATSWLRALSVTRN